MTRALAKAAAATLLAAASSAQEAATLDYRIGSTVTNIAPARGLGFTLDQQGLAPTPLHRSHLVLMQDAGFGITSPKLMGRIGAGVWNILDAQDEFGKGRVPGMGGKHETDGWISYDSAQFHPLSAEKFKDLSFSLGTSIQIWGYQSGLADNRKHVIATGDFGAQYKSWSGGLHTRLVVRGPGPGGMAYVPHAEKAVAAARIGDYTIKVGAGAELLINDHFYSQDGVKAGRAMASLSARKGGMQYAIEGIYHTNLDGNPKIYTGPQLKLSVGHDGAMQVRKAIRSMRR